MDGGGASVGTASTLTISITPRNPIPSDGKLVIEVPQSWPNDPLTSAVISSTPTCLPVSNLDASL